MKDGSYPEFAADCWVRTATDILAHRWDPVILAALGEGPKRRAELRRRIGQIADKPLTEALTRLMAASLVARAARSDCPTGMYELTTLGRSFHDGPLRVLAEWARAHGNQLA